MSPMLLAFDSVGVLAAGLPCSATPIPNLCGFSDELLRALPRTSSTHASLSGLMETCLDRGFGPARPRGVELFKEGMDVEGVNDLWNASLADDAAPTEVLDETESRRWEKPENGENDVSNASPPLVALISPISDTFEGLLFLRTETDDAGRELITDGGRGGCRSLAELYPGELFGVSPCTSTRGVSVALRRP